MLTIRGFEVLATLGQGGMGLVYQARQPSMARDVALKEMRFGAQGNPDFAARFLQEARIGGSLAHPNIVVVYDYLEANGAAYIAMEFVERGPLTALMRRLTVPQSLGVLEALLSALSRAGEAGIVHRDLKPANLLVTRDGTIKVADFGIAKAIDATTQLGLTAPGFTVGTPAYMAPEQAEGGAVDPRTDLYATGALAYEMLSGQPPFDPELSWPSLLYKHVHERPTSPQVVNPNLHPAFGDWIERLLAKNPDDRPPNAATAWGQLEEIAVERLGWRWRHDARLSDGSSDADRQPLTPAPFVGSGPSAAYHTYNEPPPPREMRTGELERDLGRGAPATPTPTPTPTPTDPPAFSADTRPPTPPSTSPTRAKDTAHGRTQPRRRVAAMSAAAAAAVAIAVGAIVAFGGDGSDRDAAVVAASPASTTPAGTPTATPTTNPATPSPGADQPAHVKRLMSLIPASIRSDCRAEASEYGDDLAQVSCERAGATLYYELYKDALEAKHWFSIGVGNAKEESRRRAKSCSDAGIHRAYVGTWTKPGQSGTAGQMFCTYERSSFSSGGLVRREWTTNGSPIVSSLLYSGPDRRMATDGAELAWRQAQR